MSDRGIFFNPRTDYGFKLLFGQEKSKEFLIHFLNALLNGEYVITDVTYRDKEQIAPTSEERNIIYDIYCTTDKGHHILIEMQNARQSNFFNRCEWYMARSVVMQNQKGSEWNYKLEPVLGVFIMNFETEVTQGRLLSTAEYVIKENGKVLNKFPKMYFINLHQAKEVVSDDETDFERWANILKYMETMTKIPYGSLESLKREAKNIWDKLQSFATIHNFDKAQMEAYEDSLRAYRDAIAVREAAIEDGLAEGRAKGRAEELKMLVNKFKAKGFSVEEIADMCDLTLDDVKTMLEE